MELFLNFTSCFFVCSETFFGAIFVFFSQFWNKRILKVVPTKNWKSLTKLSRKKVL